MYRSALVSFVLTAAIIGCKGGASSASAANTNTSGAASSTTSDTSGTAAGPISTTQTTAPGSAASTAGGTSANTASASRAPLPGKPNPNRVPNEMGRIMVLEYHLITDHNG